MYLQGMTMRAIGHELGISVKTVFNDMERARQKWREVVARSYEEHLPAKLAELDAVRAAAWEGWKRSLEDDVTDHKEKGSNSQGSNSKRSKKRRRQSGNPAFLARVESATRMECKLLGLLDRDSGDGDTDAPKIVEVIITSREEHEEFNTISLENYQRRIGQAS
jgi:hypothetical protein